MRQTLSTLFILLFSGFAFSQTLSVKVEMLVSGEYSEIDEAQALAQGWKLTHDQFGEPQYTFEKSISAKELPLRASLGDGYFSISKNGIVSMGISVGDADASSRGSFTLPQSEGRLLPLSPVSLEVSGGDHASGMWSFDAKATLSVK